MENILINELAGKYDKLMASYNNQKLWSRVTVHSNGTTSHHFIVTIDDEIKESNENLNLCLDTYNKLK